MDTFSLPSVQVHQQTTSSSADTVTLELSFDEHLPCLQGHFPDHPILPGVVQVDWAIALGRQHCGIAGAFTGMQSIKFMRIMQPNNDYQLLLKWQADKAQLHYSYQQGDQTCSSGKIQFQLAGESSNNDAHAPVAVSAL